MIERGAIVSLSVKGPYTSKPRPWVVVQNDIFPHTDSITLAPFTHVIAPDAPLLRIDVQPTAGNGLKAHSQVQVDKVSTVHRTDVHKVIGHLEPASLDALSRALRLFLDL